MADRYVEIPARLISAGAAALLLAVWIAITAAAAFSGRLRDINQSYARELNDVYVLDAIAGSIDRLTLAERAVLSGDDGRFVDAVWSSVVMLDRDLDILGSLAGHGEITPLQVAQLTGAVKAMLNGVARCDQVEDARGRRAALLCLDHADEDFARAQAQAAEMKADAIRRVFDRPVQPGVRGGLVRAVLDGAPAAIASSRPRGARPNRIAAR